MGVKRFKFAKLVRDKIVESQIASGTKPHYRLLTNDEHKHELVNKIIEEAREITEANSDEVANEIADVQQAIDDLIEKLNLTKQDIDKAQKIKRDKSGAFKRGVYIDYVEVDESDKWITYYRKHPDRYPEI